MCNLARLVLFGSDMALCLMTERRANPKVCMCWYMHVRLVLTSVRIQELGWPGSTPLDWRSQYDEPSAMKKQVLKSQDISRQNYVSPVRGCWVKKWMAVSSTCNELWLVGGFFNPVVCWAIFTSCLPHLCCLKRWMCNKGSERSLCLPSCPVPLCRKVQASDKL